MLDYEKLSLLIHVPASLFRKEKIIKYFKPSESNDQVAQWEVESCWASCDVDDVQGDNNLLAECLESNLHFVATSLGVFHNVHLTAVQCSLSREEQSNIFLVSWLVGWHELSCSLSDHLDGNFSGDHWPRHVSLSNLITHADNCPKLWDGFDLLFVSSESQQR